MLVDPAIDIVSIGGRRVRELTSHVYLVVNKPRGIVVTASDERGRQTVFDLVGDRWHGRRLFAVGRLDIDSSGLLILTDDGELANLLMHPSHEVPKEYRVVVRGSPSAESLSTLRRGVDFEDGRTQPAEVAVVNRAADYSELRIVIREGRNRQVRRMMAAVGHPVRSLERTRIGPVTLEGLSRGRSRELRAGEVAALRASTR